MIQMYLQIKGEYLNEKKERKKAKKDNYKVLF